MTRSTAATGAQLLRRFTQAAATFSKSRPVQADVRTRAYSGWASR